MSTIQNLRPVFAYDFSDTFVSGGVRYLRDHGPSDLHLAFAAGVTDPTATLDGGMEFNGAQYLNMAAGAVPRFYARAPIGYHAWFAKFTPKATNAQNRRLFSCYSTGGGAGAFGIEIGHHAVDRLIYGYIRTGGASNLYSSSATGLLVTSGRQMVIGAAIAPAPYGMHASTACTYTWLAGGYGPPIYDTDTVPRVGDIATGGAQFIGTLYYLALLGAEGLPSLSPMQDDLQFMDRMLCEGSRPFCWRQT